MRQSIPLLWLILLPFWAHAQLYTDYLGNGHLNGITVRSSDDRLADHKGSETINGFPANDQTSLADASRFLAQASYGGSMAEIHRVQQIGYDAWLEEQFRMKPHLTLETLQGFMEWFNQQLEERVAQIELPSEELAEEFDFDFPVSKDAFRTAWFHNAMTAPDQLHQRVALALSEMMVISDHPDELEDTGLGLSHYYDRLLLNALGNYRDLLWDVSLHPAMGFYLTHFNNPKADTANNVHPDENYAREVMQLFSIGLYELNLDGSRKKDLQGNDIPTYGNQDIKEFARIFTGLSGEYYGEFEPEEPADFGANFEEVFHLLPMKMYEEQHEPGVKTLLNGQIVPAGQTGLQDIADAIDNLYHHPNVGPFLGRHLIQRLVTSNPTPEYIARVATAFNDNGQGVRGDMKAVVKAVLMDDEARRCSDRFANENRAMLREPIVRYLHFCRAMELKARDDAPYFFNPGYRFDDAVGQMPLSAPSVFNFFLPDYQPNGIIADLNLFAPEFQIHNSNTSIQYINEVQNWAIYRSPIDENIGNEIYGLIDEFLEEADLEIDLEEEDENEEEMPPELPLMELQTLADSPEVLLDHLNLLLVHGQLSPESYQSILTAIRALEEAEFRVSLALYLIMISPDYTILN
ncbi:MAG: DUF1800 family protein [Bacteroidota bacterium]